MYKTDQMTYLVINIFLKEFDHLSIKKFILIIYIIKNDQNSIINEINILVAKNRHKI